MAIGRISGPMLKNDLVRQGVDLSFEGNLLYLDVTNLKIGINKSSPSNALSVLGNIDANNLSVVTNVYSNGLYDGTQRALTQVTNGGGISATISGNTITFGSSGLVSSVINGGGITGYVSSGNLQLGSSANNTNTASTIVQRDAAGDFAANVITANNGFLDGTLRALTQVTNGGGVTGTVSGNTLTLGASGFANSVINASGINGTINAAGVLALSVSAGAFANSVVNASGINAYITGGGALTLSVQAGSIVNSVSNGGGITGYITGDGSLTLGSNGSSANGASTIVTRGTDGSFTANIITAEAFTSTRAGTTGDGTGQIFLNGATGNRIDWNTNGVAAPAFTTRSAGTKLTLYPAVTLTQADYAIGIEAATLWHSIPSYDPSFNFKWYGGTTQIASLNGTGNLTTNIITANSGLYDGTFRAITQVSNSGGVTGTISGNTLTVGINGPYANSVTNGGGITGTISASGALTLGSTANSSNSASTIVERGADGSFTANIITANNGLLDGLNRTLALVTNGGGVTGAVVGNTLTLGAVGFANSVVNAGGINGVISGAGVLTLSITPAAIVNSIVNGGGITGTISATGALTLNSNGSSSNGASTIVTRDAAGNFTSNVITASNGFLDGTLRTLTQVTNGGGVTGTVSGNTLTLGAVGFANSVTNANGIQGSISGAGVLTLVVAPGSIANSVSNSGGITGFITNSGVLTLNSNATSSNSASTIVQRDAAGNFTANVITASNGFFDGTLRAVTQITNGGGVTGVVSGNTITLGAVGFANSVTNGGGITGTISGAGLLTLNSNATSSNSASTIVQRDAAGNFTANVITASNGFFDGTLRTLAQVTNGGGVTGVVSGNALTLGAVGFANSVVNAGGINGVISGAGVLTLSVTAGGIVNSIVNSGGITGTISATGALTLSSNANSSNSASTIVQRDGAGNFTANIITASNGFFDGTLRTLTQITNGGGVTGTVSGNTLTLGAFGFANSVVNASGINGTISGAGVLTLSVSAGAIVNSVTNSGGITGTISGTGVLALGSNANSSNSASTIIQRDAAGNFTANVITANNGFLDGTLRAVTQVANGGGVTGTVSGNTITLGSNANSSNSVSTIVARGADGSFAANIITATLYGAANTANTATSATTAGTVTTNAQPNITSVGTLTALTSSGAVSITDATTSVNTTTGALTVAGGVGIGGNIHVLGPNSTIYGNLTVGNLRVTGNTTTIGSVDLAVADSIINLHTPADLSPLTVDDGRDIGIAFHYFKTQEDHAFVGWSNDTGYLEYYDSGTEVGNVFTGNTYGTIKTGGMILVNTLPATNTTTGTLTVAGGISSQGNIYGNALYDGINRVLTTANHIFSNINASSTFINAATSTDTLTFTPGPNVTITANAITKTITIDSITGAGASTDNLQNVTSRGATTANTITITNAAAATNTTTGALQVTGGISTQNTMYAAGGHFDGANRTLALVTNGGGVTGTVSGNTITLGAVGFANSVTNGGGITGTITGAGVLTLGSNGSSANGASTIVTRDAAGNFTANVITASNGFFDGTLRTVTQVTNGGGVTGTISGNTITLGAVGFANSVTNGGGITGTITGAGVLTLNSNATSSNSASTIVQRDAAGNFTANVITASNGHFDGTLRTLAQVTNGGGVTGTVSGNTLTLGAVGFANSVVNAGGINGVISGAGVLTLSVSAGGIVNSIVNGGGITGTISTTGALTLGSTANSSNSASTIVQRDAAGNFIANVITASNGFFDGTLRTVTQVTNGGGVTGTVTGNTITLGAVGFANSVTNGGGITGTITGAGVLTLGSNANSSNSASTIVQRDAAGNFTANVITASNGHFDGTLRTLAQVTNGGGVTGTVSGNTLTLGAVGFANSVVNAGGINGVISGAGVLTLSVTAGGIVNSIVNGGGITGTISATGALTLGSNGSSANGASTIVTRDAAGNFTANAITASNGFFDGTLRTVTQVTNGGGVTGVVSGNTITLGAVGFANSVSNGGGITGTISGAGVLTLNSNANASNSASTIVSRGADGSFAANIITANNGFFDGTLRAVTQVTPTGGVSASISGNTLSISVNAGSSVNSVSNGGGVTGFITPSGVLTLGSNATSSNVSNAIVSRDTAGNFTANVVTANNGFFDGANRTFALVTNGGGITGVASGNTITLGSNATSSNVSNAIVSRDTDGSFAANIITASKVNVTSTAAASSPTTGAIVVAGGAGIAGELWLGSPGGDEGGQINFSLATANTTLNTSVIIDVYQNKLRIFESGGTNRGAFIDLTTAGAAVSSNLLAGGGGGGGGVTSVSNGGGITGTITGSTLNLGSTANTSNSASTIVQRDAAGSFAGNVITGDTFVSLNNGAGTNFKVGDDAWIGDINTADTMSIRGQQNAANGFIVFGNADSTSTLGRSGSGPLTYTGNANVTANLTAGNANIRGIVTVTGNITAGNIIAGGARSTTSATAPTNPTVGDMWYDTDTDVLYRYTYDGVSYFWIDIAGAAGGSPNTTTLGNAIVNSGNITIVTPNVATLVQTLSASTYKTLRYTMQAAQGADNLQIDDVVLGVINNTVSLGQVSFINPATGDMVNYTANIQSSNVSLFANVTSANTVITFVRTAING